MFFNSDFCSPNLKRFKFSFINKFLCVLCEHDAEKNNIENQITHYHPIPQLVESYNYHLSL